MTHDKPQAEATPRPWAMERDGEDVYIQTPAPKPTYTIALLRDGFPYCNGPGETDANAALIVRSVNLHEEMVTALDRIAAMTDPTSTIGSIARAVLAKAGRE